MEINKKELRKISRKFRVLASNVMNTYFKEQGDALKELINYINETPLIYDYLQSISYDITGLEENLDSINSSYGREALNLGTNTQQRVYLLYKTFEYILDKNMSTYIFGWYYTN